MTALRRAGVTAALAMLVGSALPAGPAAARRAAPPAPPAPAATTPVRAAPVALPAHPTAEDLRRLQTALTETRARADLAYAVLARTTARLANLEVERARLEEDRSRARAALDDRIRRLYMHGRPDPFESLFIGFDGPDATMLRAGLAAGFESDESLLRELHERERHVDDLQRAANADYADVVAQAHVVYAAHEQARDLLDRAAVAFARDQAVLAELARQRALLDAQATQVRFTVAPAVTARGRAAAAAEAPIIELLERAPSATPAGYHATGQRISGVASWYGPGFVGNPTATGASYDPERLTAAMLAVPLGTVVRVTAANGRSVTVLVNDRGPYVAGRVIDLSRRAAAELGFTGVLPVQVEVLERG